jgi:7-cyano-7-deazaguanine synthase in queuosine biosynthesis
VAKNDSTKLAISYGAQAFDMLEVYEKLLSNQKAQTEQLGLAYQESKIQTDLLTKKVAKIKKESFWQKLWANIKILIAVAAGYGIAQL